MIHYTRTSWYGVSYLMRLHGSLLPRALPAMLVAGAIAFTLSSGLLTPLVGWDLTTFFDDPFGMQMFGVVRQPAVEPRAFSPCSCYAVAVYTSRLHHAAATLIRHAVACLRHANVPSFLSRSAGFWLPHDLAALVMLRPLLVGSDSHGSYV